MASTMKSADVVEPSRSQLALALAIVKQKPPTEGIKEHLVKIRNFIKIRKESDIVTDGKFFDSVCFWQKAHEESQEEQTKLLNTIYELEQHNQTLLSKVNKEFLGGENKNRSSTKRKVGGAGLTLGGSEAGKKTSRARLTKNKPETMDDQVEPPSLMRPLYALQRALQRRRSPNSLAVDAVVLCKAAEWELLSAIQSDNQGPPRSGHASSQKAKEPGLLVVIRGVEVSFDLVHRSLKTISSAKNGTQCKGQVTYYLVCLFESTLTALTQHCTAACEQTTPGQSQSLHRKPETYENLTDLLSTMMLSLDPSRQEDQEVMEGFFFVTLDRVGKMLALFVFNNLHLPTEVCPKLRPPDGLAAMTREGVSPQKVQLEAKHLMIFLDNVLGPNSPLNSANSSVQSQFVQKMKSRLQKTLLQTVFGADDPLFRDGLVRPVTPPPQNRDARHVDQPEFPEWFTQELWRLVGWDTLSSTLRSR